MITVVLATRNGHKVREVGQILGPVIRLLQLNDFPGAPTPVEDADTFAGNAAKKVLSLAGWLKANPSSTVKPISSESACYLLADDSGLEVDALDGAPGVHSARFAAGDAAGTVNTPDAANNAKLMRLLEGVPPERRTARFRCVLALLRLHPSLEKVAYFEGACEGSISLAPSGRGGFGYDPLFVPSGCAQSFADLGDDIKNQLSHRARALAKLKSFLAGETA